jgi:hypothetical protein
VRRKTDLSEDTKTLSFMGHRGLTFRKFLTAVSTKTIRELHQSNLGVAQTNTLSTQLINSKADRLVCGQWRRELVPADSRFPLC